MKIIKFALFFILLLTWNSQTNAQNNKSMPAIPELPLNLEISYPNGNPLRDALEPVPEDAVFKMEGFYLWDPSVIRVGTTYHLFCSRWPAKEGMNGWRSSQVVRATSKSLFGPYHFQEVVLNPSDHPWATQGIHNPKITKAGTKFLIYHLGIPQWKTGFAFADSIQGPWKPIPYPVIATNNPALLIRKNGSAYAVGKFKPKKFRDGKWDANMQAFEAKDVNGPYVLVKDTLNRLPENFELEDPTIWWANNQYNVVCTDWEAKVTGVQKSVIYYTSKDGVNYVLYSQIPVWSQKDPVPMQNGSSIRVSGVERPQVFLNDEGAVVALLVSVHPAEDIPTYIIIRPVKSFMPEN